EPADRRRPRGARELQADRHRHDRRPHREEQRARQAVSVYRLTATYLVSRYSSIPSGPPSRPKPDCLIPPNGAAGFETMPWLRPTIPVSSRSTTLSARRKSFV